jgi:hypothetical protein
MAEGIEHAFVREHAARQRELISGVCKLTGHEDAPGTYYVLPMWNCSKSEMRGLAKKIRQVGMAGKSPTQPAVATRIVCANS